MSIIRLFRVSADSSTEIHGAASKLEKPLQKVIEGNLNTLLGIRFLATEFSTGKEHSGRIDTLGLDQDRSPVIIEYKRSKDENVVSQGKYYRKWLMDHKGDFRVLVQDKIGPDDAANIDWTAPRIICIAANFTKFDKDTIDSNDQVELIRYEQFGSDLLLFDFVNAAEPVFKPKKNKPQGGAPAAPDGTVTEGLSNLNPSIAAVFESLNEYIKSLGDDVHRKNLKFYVAYKRLRNFACVKFQKNQLVVYVDRDPVEAQQFKEIADIAKDVRNIGHNGTGDLELRLGSLSALERVKFVIHQAYQGI